MKTLLAITCLASVLIGCRTVNESERLIGKPAPDFKLELLDGGEARLGDHLGKNVVILDFWATWCGPCRAAMPVIHEVATRYKNKGVVLYAVNEDEEKEDIRKFLAEKPLMVTVALDPGAKVGLRYGTDTIPRTVIIDTNGVVRAVHVGALADLNERLTADLEALVNGRPSAH